MEAAEAMLEEDVAANRRQGESERYLGQGLRPSPPPRHTFPASATNGGRVGAVDVLVSPVVETLG